MSLSIGDPTTWQLYAAVLACLVVATALLSRRKRQAYETVWNDRSGRLEMKPTADDAIDERRVALRFHSVFSMHLPADRERIIRHNMAKHNCSRREAMKMACDDLYWDRR